MLKVTFRTKIYYKSEADLWEAEIELNLPLDRNAKIPKELRSTRKIFGEPVGENWGIWLNNPYRSRVVKIEASTKDEVKNRVSSIIEDTVRALRDIKVENKILSVQEEHGELYVII